MAAAEEQKYTNLATEDFAKVLLILQDAIKLASENKLEEATKRIGAGYGAAKLVLDMDEARQATGDMARKTPAEAGPHLLLDSLLNEGPAMAVIVENFYKNTKMVARGD